MKLQEVRVPRSLTILAIPLLGVTLIVAGAIGATAATRVTVKITVKDRSATTSVPLSVQDPASATADDIPGVIRQTVVDVSGTAPATGTATLVGTAHGTVTLENHWNQVQPLAATTRLLSSGGVLFRTDKRVDVPVGGTVAVTVTADQPGEAGNVGPEHFTIVALWPGIQDKIFGTSTSPMTGGGGSGSGVSEADLTKAQLDAETNAETEAAAALTKDTPSGMALMQESVAPVSEQALNHTASGTAATEATVRLRVTVRGLLTDAGRLRSAVTSAVEREFPGESVTGLQLTPKLANAPLPGGPFTVTVVATLAPNQSALQPSLLAGKTPDAATNVLKRAPGVTDVVITGLPFWSHHLPAATRIHILVAST